MKLLLLTSPSRSKVKTWVCQETSVVGSLIPPMDLCYVAAYVRKHGHKAMVEDLRLSKNWRHTLRTALDIFRPDVVCTNLLTTGAIEDLQMLSVARQLRPEIRVAAFGTHAEALPDEVMSLGVDCILVGDPEAAVLSLLEGKPDGVRDAQHREVTPALLASPDDVPIDGPDFIDLNRYHAAHHHGASRFVPLIASRGCPYKCTYCLYPALFGAKARYRSARNMADELAYLRSEYGVDSVNYLDATFNLNKPRVLELCKELASRKLGVQWACNVRCDLLDDEMLSAMREAGCFRLYLGVEDPELFSDTKKSLTRRAVTDAFAMVRRHDIRTVAFLMLFPNGAPSEDEYFRRQKALVQELRPDAIQINVSVPFPGTADYETQKDGLSRDWAKYDPSGNEFPYPLTLDLPAVRRRLYRWFIARHPQKVAEVLRGLTVQQVAGLGMQFARHLI